MRGPAWPGRRGPEAWPGGPEGVARRPGSAPARGVPAARPGGRRWLSRNTGTAKAGLAGPRLEFVPARQHRDREDDPGRSSRSLRPFGVDQGAPIRGKDLRDRASCRSKLGFRAFDRQSSIPTFDRLSSNLQAVLSGRSSHACRSDRTRTVLEQAEVLSAMFAAWLATARDGGRLASGHWTGILRPCHVDPTRATGRSASAAWPSYSCSDRSGSSPPSSILTWGLRRSLDWPSGSSWACGYSSKSTPGTCGYVAKPTLSWRRGAPHSLGHRSGRDFGSRY